MGCWRRTQTVLIRPPWLSSTFPRHRVGELLCVEQNIKIPGCLNINPCRNIFYIPCSVRLCTGCMVWDIRHSRLSHTISNSATGSRGKTPPPWKADWCRLRPSPIPFRRKSKCLISQHPNPVHSRTNPPLDKSSYIFPIFRKSHL